MKIPTRYIRISLLFFAMVLVGKTGTRAQDIASIAKSDPLIITGAVGTQNTFSWASGGSGYTSPFSNSVYASLNFNIYGFSMPFSFYYSNDNASFSLPQVSFNVSPTYKGWTLYLGQHSMPFSQYVYSMPFNGVGLEYRSQKGHGLRFGMFYGTLKKAINVDPDYISVKSPQFKRIGYGVKCGYGSGRNFVDLYVFRGKDELSSIDEIWYDQIDAKENIVVGAKGRLGLGRHMSLSANFATSLFSTDIRSRKVEVEAVKRYSDIFDVRYSSQVKWAGDASLSGAWGRFNASLNYKIVQPDYTTLGVSYVTSNYQSFGASVMTSIGKAALSGSFNAQADNLSGLQLYTTCGFVYNGAITLPIGRRYVLTASYNGYLQTQRDGVEHVTDSARVHRRMDSYSLSQTINFPGTLVPSSLSLTGNLTSNEDLNPTATGESDVKTLALGGNYSFTVLPIETTFSANVSHQSTDGYNMKYRTIIYSMSASRSFLANKELNVTAMASLTDNNIVDKTRNMSVGGYLSASYTLKEVHQFSLSGSVNRYQSQDILLNGATDDYINYTCSLNYNYTFSVFHLKRQVEKGKKRYTSDFIRKPKQKTPDDPNKRY